MDVPIKAIVRCLEARERAVLLPKHNTKVGACLYSKDGDDMYDGFNIQNRCHKSYHAEEIAILNWMIDIKYTKPIGMIVSFSDTIERITFCCGHCRQMIWETFNNPDFLVTEVDLNGNIVESRTIKELYPNPYPR